jgi:hypothetical protein
VRDFEWLPRGPAYSSAVTLPYANGETPVLGDYVKNDLAQPRGVTSVRFSHDGQDYIKVRANDGSVDLPLAPAEEFTLISSHAYPGCSDFSISSSTIFRTSSRVQETPSIQTHIVCCASPKRPIKRNVKRYFSSSARCRHFFRLGIQPNRLNVHSRWASGLAQAT